MDLASNMAFVNLYFNKIYVQPNPTFTEEQDQLHKYSFMLYVGLLVLNPIMGLYFYH